MPTPVAMLLVHRLENAAPVAVSVARHVMTMVAMEMVAWQMHAISAKEMVLEQMVVVLRHQ